jgi:hypothetical protein
MPSGRLPPWIVQIAGLAVVFVSLVTWIETGRETAIFVGAGLTMIGLGVHLESGQHDK